MKLEVLSLKDLQTFQSLYKQCWPKYCQEYYCLDNFIEFLKQEPHIKNLKLFTLDTTQAREEGLFVIVVSSIRVLYESTLYLNLQPVSFAHLLGSLSTLCGRSEQHKRAFTESSGFIGLV